MTFQIELTASPALLDAVNRLADAFGGKQAVKIPIAQKQEVRVIEKEVAVKAVGTLEEMPEEGVAEPEVSQATTEGVYDEERLMNMSVDEMTKLLKERYNINPSHTEGKNTNRKLRLLVLDAQKGVSVEAPEEVEEVEAEVEEVEAEVEEGPIAKKTKGGFIPDVAVVRELGVKLRNDGKIKLFKEVLTKYGAGSISEAAELSNFGDFYNDLLAL